MNMDEPVWDATVFTKNPGSAVGMATWPRSSCCRWCSRPRDQGLTSDECFTVDGTLIEAWVSLKRFQRKDQKNPPPPDDPGNPTVSFHGEKRSNQLHESKTDSDAKLAEGQRRGSQAELQSQLAGGEPQRNHPQHGSLRGQRDPERDTALLMLEQIPGGKWVTVGAEQGVRHQRFCFGVPEFAGDAERGAKREAAGGSAIDARTTRHAGYAASQQKRKRI